MWGVGKENIKFNADCIGIYCCIDALAISLCKSYHFELCEEWAA